MNETKVMYAKVYHYKMPSPERLKKTLRIFREGEKNIHMQRTVDKSSIGLLSSNAESKETNAKCFYNSKV
jgi:hypothetical protein